MSPSPRPTHQQMVDYVRSSDPFINEMCARRVIAREGRDRARRSMVTAERVAFDLLTVPQQEAWVDAFITEELARYKRDGRAERNDDPDGEAREIELAGRNMTTWRPDTCACRVRFSDGPDRWERTLETCPEHSAIGDALYSAIKGENGRKNGLLSIVAAMTDEATRERVAWQFTAARLPGSDERVLSATIPGVSGGVRNQIRSAADVQFGAGAIEIA